MCDINHLFPDSRRRVPSRTLMRRMANETLNCIRIKGHDQNRSYIKMNSRKVRKKKNRCTQHPVSTFISKEGAQDAMAHYKLPTNLVDSLKMNIHTVLRHWNIKNINFIIVQKYLTNTSQDPQTSLNMVTILRLNAWYSR
jgi:hypothetical protein